jgi:hypothetical protein
MDRRVAHTSPILARMGMFTRHDVVNAGALFICCSASLVFMETKVVQTFWYDSSVSSLDVPAYEWEN